MYAVQSTVLCFRGGFLTPDEHFRCHQMPLGLKNASIALQLHLHAPGEDGCVRVTTKILAKWATKCGIHCSFVRTKTASMHKEIEMRFFCQTNQKFWTLRHIRRTIWYLSVVHRIFVIE